MAPLISFNCSHSTAHQQAALICSSMSLPFVARDSVVHSEYRTASFPKILYDTTAEVWHSLFALLRGTILGM